MKMLFHAFPLELLRYLLGYLENEEKVAFVSSLKEWYNLLMKREIRHLHIRRFSKDWEEKVHLLVMNPLSQLSLTLNGFVDMNILRNLLKDIDYKLYKINCHDVEIMEILKSTSHLIVQKLIIESTGYQPLTLFQIISDKIMNCESLTLYFSSYQGPNAIPYIPTIKELSIEYEDESLPLYIPLLLQYSTHLHRLVLNNCIITDVSMLGFIPCLELRNCSNLSDISALNDNDQVIIHRCDSIQDFTCSFARSRKIEITVWKVNSFSFNPNSWTCLVDLHLQSFLSESSNYRKNKYVPTTTQRCFLSGGFISIVNFTIPVELTLEELSLASDDSITSLKGYGLERVAIVKCQWLRSLQSLEGLGRGRNRKINIAHCDQITDFSPLNHVPIVEINNCDGFTNPLQVSCVRDLTIKLKKGMSFQIDHSTRDPYRNIHSLTILNTRHLRVFDGLEKIPHLGLDVTSHYLLRKFIEEGKELLNEKIEFTGDLKLELQNIYNVAVIMSDYDYYRVSSRQCIFLKKKEI